MFKNMVQPLLAQADRISRKDNDLSQDIISMAYTTYRTAQGRNKNLSIGELVNFMKYRATELRNGKRSNFGNITKKRRRDVYNSRNYYNGSVKLLSLDFSMHDGEYQERSFDGQGELTIATGTKDISDNVLFQIGFERFFQQINPEDQQMLILRIKGYNYSEIKRLVDFAGGTVQARLKNVGRSFIKYFELPRRYLYRFRLA